MIGMSEVIMPVVSGMEFPLPLAPLAGEGIVSEQGLLFSLPPKEMSQWEQFEDCSQSLELVVKSLGDGIAKEQVLDKVEFTQVGNVQKPQVNAAAPQSVQAPESVTVSRLVDAIVEKIAVSSTLMANGEGEIRIQLKSDILDGSSIKIEVKNGELKVVVEPASHTAEQILIKSQETFQNQLAERVTAWRVNVGIAAFDSRSGLRRRLEEQS